MREGKRRVIVPSNAVWDDFFDSPGIDLPHAINPALKIANRFDAEVLAGHEPLHSCVARSNGFVCEKFNLEAESLAISTIVLTELHAKSARQDADEVENFARLEVLSFDAAAAHHAADIRATLERQGRAIGGYDILIAGHARSRALIVVTGNRGEFDRVPGAVRGLGIAASVARFDRAAGALRSPGIASLRSQ